MKAPGADLSVACDAQASGETLKMVERIARLKTGARHAAVGIKERVSLYPVLLTLSIATRLGAEEEYGRRAAKSRRLLRQKAADRVTVGIGCRSFLAQTAEFAGGAHGGADIGKEDPERADMC
jgi:hypothetical protein